MEWGVTNLDHFLDDFITTGHPRSNECSTNLVLLMDTCKILKLPLALSKLEGPSTCLGIELDSYPSSAAAASSFKIYEIKGHAINLD